MTITQLVQGATQVVNQHALLILLIVTLAVMTFLNRKQIHNSWQNFKTRYCLSRLGLKQVVNFQFPDGLGHYFTIDRLILREDGITLLIYKRYPGKIYCAEQIDEWTQMLGQKSYRFNNPFHELDNQVNTISAYIPGVPVNGYLFFDYLAEFPKGHPERVITLREIPGQLKTSRQKHINKSVEAAWGKLLNGQ